MKAAILDYGSTVAWTLLTISAAAGTVLFAVETFIRGREAHARGLDRIRRATEASEIPTQRVAR